VVVADVAATKVGSHGNDSYQSVVLKV